MNRKKFRIRMDLLLITIICVFFHPVLCIVGRDLVLTPRQGLQLTGKSIYYEEDSNEVLRNYTVHPWERTLKHVTFVTLFTEAATSAVAGNISKLKEYTDFLESPYISKENANSIRFGDIVMLANGRLEQASNGSFRFIEGTCSYDCQPERVWALWQVQKIRHRDQNRNFRYEMKFSISPLRTEAQLNELRDPAAQNQEPKQSGDMYVRRNALKTYIQREDDYPQSFGRIIYPEEAAFAHKRQDDNFVGRNFRQVNDINDYRQVTPMTPLPQPTFLHGVFHPHPGLPPPPQLRLPHPQRLNLGEYVKELIHHPQATPKIELFPNPYHLINRNHFPMPVPTTFRPNYDIKLPRPEIYQPQHETFVRFPTEHENKLNAPQLVTHHFHHLFFMPENGEINANNSGENHITSAEQQETQQHPATFDTEINRQVTPTYYNNNKIGYNVVTTTPRQESNFPPAPHKISFPIMDFGEHIVEVTPPTLKRPQIYPVYPINYAGKAPVLVYTAPNSAQITATTLKPFIQSEPIAETIRYSEPDPLYRKNESQSGGGPGTQVESSYFNPETTTNSKRLQQQNEAIEAQLTTPARDQTDGNNNDYESQEDNFKRITDQIPYHSQKETKISPNSLLNSPNGEKTQTERGTFTPFVVSTTSTTTSNPIISPPRHGTTPLPSTTETGGRILAHKNNPIVSTSTTESPLRSISRVRTGRPATTTVDPKILKWKPKRRNGHNAFKYNSKRERNKNDDDTKPKISTRKEETESSLNSNSGSFTAKPLETNQKVLEVLTQKSVSKSVSIKVGSDGQEIPFLTDDIAENEVKTQ